jgi:hypothetical protein
MAVPIRYPAGVSTQAPNRNLANYPNPDPTKVYTVFDDFGAYVAARYTVTAVGTGTVANAAGVGGRALFTTTAGATDAETILDNPLDLNFTTAQQVWGYYKLQAADVTVPAMVVGTFASLAGTLVITDGMYFRKNAAAVGVWDFVLTKASTSTTLASVAVGTAATDIELGFYYNGKDAVDVFVNEIKVASQTVLTNLPAAVALGSGAGILNGSAVAKTMNVDFLLTAQDRV